MERAPKGMEPKAAGRAELRGRKEPWPATRTPAEPKRAAGGRLRGKQREFVAP